MIAARSVKDDRELVQILDLQQENLARNLAPEQIAAQGFVTVEHTLDVRESSTSSTMRTADP